MILRYYGLFDSVAETLRTTFTCENDEVCIRSCREIAKDPKADYRALKDCIVKYLYSIDTQTGQVVDIAQRDIVTMAGFVEEAEALKPVDDAEFSKIKESLSKVITNMKNLIDNDRTCEEQLKSFFTRLGNLEEAFNKLLKGEIKCQKYKKHKKK